MKKVFLFLLLPALFISACSKNKTEVVPKEEQPTTYAISIPVKDEQGNTRTSISFNSQSKEALDAMNLDQLKFKARELTIAEYHQVHATSLESSCDPITAHFSYKNVKQNADSFNDPTIWATMDDTTSNVSIEVSYDPDLTNKKVSTQYPANLYVRLLSKPNARRIQVQNGTDNPLDVAFYYAPGCNGDICTTIAGLGPYTKFSGYEYTLNKGGWAYYYNCSKDVAAQISIDKSKSIAFSWIAWTVCKP